jgi:tetratricopeptide (TPR) repeat protein
MYFDRNEYELSQAYYDTAVSSMDREMEGYDSILNISQTLNELVMYATVVRDQDSLLRVAAMDSVSRNILIDHIIAQVIQEEELQKAQQEYEEQLALMGAATGDAPKSEPTSTSSGSSWYFYNQTAISKGFTEFTRKWGMRKNDDNWRISDKQSLVAAFSEDDGGEELTEAKNARAKQDSLNATYTNHDRGYYLRDLPFEPEQKEVCDSLIADGLYHLGFIYMDRLNDLPRSIESYSQLDTRYPNNEKELPCWYALYKMYKDLGDEDNSLIYKNKIFDKYPTSSYAQFINDPEYFKKLEAQEKESSDFYAKTYDAFEQGQYYRVKINTERAMQLYENDTAMLPRFAFLHAVASGRLIAVDTMAFELYRLVHNYPSHSITPYATQVLQHINDEYHLGLVLDGKGEGKEPEVKKATLYIDKPDGEHFVMIVCNTLHVRVEPLKVRISDFNKKEYRVRNFNIRSVLLDDERTVVTIGNFDNQKAAEDYITSMFITDYVFGGIDKQYYTIKPISGINYPIFYQSKDLDEYIQFIDSKQ